jgi:putative transposase
MLKIVGNDTAQDEGDGRSLLDEIAREEARRMLVAALETEVAAYLEAHREERDAEGHALVVRNGKGRTRKVTVGAGTIPVRAPRVNDRRTDQDGERRRFHEPHPAAVHAPLPEGGRGAARALPAGALHR